MIPLKSAGLPLCTGAVDKASKSYTDCTKPTRHFNWMDYSEEDTCKNIDKDLGNNQSMVLHIHMSLIMRKPAFCICENKDADQLTAMLISTFVFATLLVQFLYFLNTKFQASSHLLWLYSLVCVGPGRNPEDRFSHDGAQI